MFSKRTFGLVALCSFIVLAAVFASSLLVVSATPDPVQRPAAFVASVPAVREATTHIMFQTEPTPTALDQTPTEVAPEPTPIIITPDPTDPGTNPSAPGGALFTIVIMVSGVLIGLLTGIISVLSVIGRVRNDPVTLTTLERLITGLANSVPAFAPVPGLLNQAGQAMEDAGETLKKVSDGQSNL